MAMKKYTSADLHG